MQREFSINIVILLLVNILVKPLYIFFIEAGIQNLVGPTEFGRYIIIFDFVFLFLFINDAGIQNYNSRFLASNRDNIGKYFGELLGFKILTGLLFAFISIVSGYFLGYLTDSRQLLMIVIAVFFFNSVFVLFRSSLSAMGYYRWDSYISSLDKILLIIGLGYLVIKGYKGDGFNIVWFPLAQLIVALMVCILAYLLVRKVGIKLFITFKLSGLWHMIKSTFPYALILLFSAAYNRADVVMLGYFLQDGEYQAGIYAAGYRFIEAGNMVGFLFASLLLPMFANMISEQLDYKVLFQFAYRWLFMIGLLISIICGVYSNEIYGLLYSPDYQSHSNILSILMGSFISVSLAHCFGSFLIADGKLKVINTIFLVGLVINVIGNYILIPTYKAEGAGYTTVFTQFFLILGMASYVNYKYRQLSVINLIIKSLGLIGVSLGIVYFICSLSLHWLIGVILIGVLILSSGLLTKWISISELKNIVNQRD